MMKWDVFKYINNDNLQESYQSMCYYLFCQQYGKKVGIFAYTNQPYIETCPIIVDKESIGFQSKFYEGKISNHTKEIKDCIQSTKTKYNNITKIQFYLHGDAYASSDKEKVSPKYQEDLEFYAKSLGITIELILDSNLEYILNLTENKYIKELFFDPNKVLKKYIEILFKRTRQYLETKSSEIITKGKKIKINRDDTINQLNSALNDTKIICIQGGAGSGKTAVLKDWYLKQNNNFPVLLFSPMQFEVSDAINFAGGNVDKNIFELIDLYSEEQTKIVIIDSSEKVFSLIYTDVFLEIIRKFFDSKWQIIFSCRSAYVENLNNLLVNYGFPNDLFKIKIDHISEENVKKILYDNYMALTQNSKVLSQLRNPFYLDKYIKSYNSSINRLDYDGFIKLVWDDCIRNDKITKNSLNIKREEVFIKVLKEGILKNRFYVNCGTFDGEAIECLIQDEIIALAKDSNDCYINYDIFEEWGLQRIINNTYKNKINSKDFYDRIGDSLAMRKEFKRFSNSKLEEENESYIKFLYECLHNSSISSLWKDEIMVCYLKSDKAEVLLNRISRTFSINEYKLFIKALNLLLVACKGFKDEKDILYKLDRYLFLQPIGSGWEYLINYSLKEFKNICCMNNILILLINITYEWTSNFKEGNTTKLAGKLAIRILDYIEEKDMHYSMGKNIMNKLYITIASSAKEQYEEINKILTTIINTWELNRDTKYREFAEFLLKESIQCDNLCFYCTERLIQMCNKCWLKIPIKDAEFPYCMMESDELEDWFDLNKYSCHDYFPSSAYLTPTLYMLRSKGMWKVIDFIITFTNHAVGCYSKSNGGKNVEKLVINVDGKNIEQLCDDRIWNMYRGTQVSTHLLESIHMALELFLFELADQLGASNLISMLKYLMENSSSASITAIVLSIAMSYPDDLFDISYMLMQTKEIFSYDTRRFVLDKTPFCIAGNGVFASVYQNERKISNQKECRSKRFEQIIFDYILTNNIGVKKVEERRKLIFEVIDNYYNQLKCENDTSLAMMLARIDLRTMEIDKVEINGEQMMVLQSCPSEELKKISEDTHKESQLMEERCSFMLWANKKYKKETSDYSDVYNNAKTIYKRIKKIFSVDGEYNGLGISYISAMYYACAILLRDFENDLTENEKKLIYKICYEKLRLVLNHQSQFQYGDGIEAVIDTLIMYVNINSNQKLASEIIHAIVLLHEQRNFDIKILKKISIKKYINSKRIVLNYYIKILEIYYNDEKNKKNENYYDKFDRLMKSVPILDFSIANPDWISFNEVKIETLIQLFKVIDVNNINQYDLSILLEAINNKYLEFESKKYSKQRYQYKYIGLYDFSKNIANLLLNSHYDVNLLLSKIEGMLNYEDVMYKILSQLIFKQDTVNQYDRFWLIWNSFYPYVELYASKYLTHNYSYKKIENNIATYFFAGIEWGEKQKEWHSFKKENCYFIDKISKDFKMYPIALYSVSKLLNKIAFNYEEEGIDWCYNIMYNNEKICEDVWLDDTCHYLVNFIQRFISKKGRKIKSDASIKAKVILCLDYLILKGESRAYLIRENL